MSALTLDQIKAKALSHVMTPDERRAQRVSMIMGLRSKQSTLTREKVESMLDEFEGQPSKSATTKR